MVQPRAGQGAVQIALRLPPEMRDKLKELADESGRSINSEILARLEESFTGNETAIAQSHLLDRVWEERAQMIKAINTQDQSLQALRSSHQALVTISKQLGELFLANSAGQPEYLVVLAQSLATFEPDLDMGTSEELPERPWEEGYPDPLYYPGAVKPAKD